MPLQLIPRPELPAFTISPPSSRDEAGDGPQAGPSTHSLVKAPSDYLPERDMQMFGSHPLGNRNEAGRGLLRCGKCRRVCMESAFGEHQRLCQIVLEGNVGKYKAGKSAIKDSTKKRRASEESDDASPTKKRPPSTLDMNLPISGEPWKMNGVKLKKSEIKRLKKEREKREKKEMKERQKAEIAERKRMRANGPVDFDKQCGVINDKGQPCARSLTCKTHTVGAKRSVPNRSKGYDELFLDWQRLNNPKWTEPKRKESIYQQLLGSVDGQMTLNSSSKGGSGSGDAGGGGVGGGRIGGGRRDSKMKSSNKQRLELEEANRVMNESEIRELLDLTALAGERCKLTIGLIGHPYIEDTDPTPANRRKKKPIKFGSNKLSNSNSSSNNLNNVLDGFIQDRYKHRYILPRPTSCDSLWRGNKEKEYNGMGIGDSLVNALLSRPRAVARISRPQLNAAGIQLSSGNVNTTSGGGGGNSKTAGGTGGQGKSGNSSLKAAGGSSGSLALPPLEAQPVFGLA